MELRPTGGARVALFDPPWLYKNYSAKGELKNATHWYDCVPIPEIAQFPLDLVMADTSVVFMWVTWPTMPDWMFVIRGLGYTFVSLAWEWRKFNPATGKYAFGGGYGTRKNLEPCLMLTKGEPAMRVPPSGKIDLDGMLPFERAYHLAARIGARSIRDFIDFLPLDEIRAPRRQHSRKPDEQYDRIELLFEGPYIELFAREKRPGWIAWGNQLGMFGVDSGCDPGRSTSDCCNTET